MQRPDAQDVIPLLVAEAHQREQSHVKDRARINLNASRRSGNRRPAQRDKKPGISAGLFC